MSDCMMESLAKAWLTYLSILDCSLVSAGFHQEYLRFVLIVSETCCWKAKCGKEVCLKYQ